MLVYGNFRDMAPWTFKVEANGCNGTDEGNLLIKFIRLFASEPLDLFLSEPGFNLINQWPTSGAELSGEVDN